MFRELIIKDSESVLKDQTKIVCKVLRKLLKERYTEELDDECLPATDPYVARRKRYKNFLKLLSSNNYSNYQVHGIWTIDAIIEAFVIYDELDPKIKTVKHADDTLDIIKSRYRLAERISILDHLASNLVGTEVKVGYNQFAADRLFKHLAEMLALGFIPNESIADRLIVLCSKIYSDIYVMMDVCYPNRFITALRKLKPFFKEGKEFLFEEAKVSELSNGFTYSQLENELRAVEESVVHPNPIMENAIRNTSFVKIAPETALNRNGVFLAITCDEFGTRADRKVKPEFKVLLNFRRDQTFGFIGGKVDEGETLREALVREVKEEIAYDISEKEVTHLASYDDNGFGIHSYHLHISVEEMDKLRINALVDNLNRDEVCGLCLSNVFPGGLEGNTALLENNYSATTKLELQEIILSFDKLMENYTRWYRKMYKCERCGTEWEDVHDCLCDDRCPSCDESTGYCNYEEIGGTK